MELSEDKLHTFTDKELWNCFQDNYLKAFSELFRRYYAVLYSYSLKLTQDENLAKDCIQEMFTNLWLKRAELPVVVAVKPYLFTIIRRQIYNSTRSAQKQLTQNGKYADYEFDIVISHEDFLIQSHLADYKQTKLREALMKLSPRQKEVIYLRFFDGLSCEAIASITTLNYQSVINLIHEAVKNLRKHLVLPLTLVSALVKLTLL